jgi:hypothetical protein
LQNFGQEEDRGAGKGSAAMLASLTELRSYRVRGRDGEIGRLDDVCVGENEWIVRYLVVDLEDLDREALLLTAYLGQCDRATHTLWADIRRAQVENTAPLDRAEPLTRRDEQELHDLYGWPVYWWEQEHEITLIGGLWEEPGEATPDAEAQEQEGPQMQFVGELLDVYGVQTAEGEVGVLQDVIIDDESWTIPYLVVGLETPGRRVLLACDFVQTIDLAARRIHVSVPQEVILQSQVIAAQEPVTPELQRSLREYYDRYSR